MRQMLLCALSTCSRVYKPSLSSDLPVPCAQKHLDPLPLDEVLGRQVAPEVLELLANLLQYDPSQRVRPMDGLAASLFDSLWSMASKFSPRIFDLKQDELSVCTKPASMATMTKRINAFTAVTTASR
mmetsp:Transcript_23656/g.50495  ORF Transcript_23656/g.50495 Transcript_23656/m.50495 type:complete len:127 (+) Transcript_23656:1081-1461(+)